MPTISVHVDDATHHEVEMLAEQLDRSKSWVVGDALRPYLEHNRWMLASTARAQAELRSVEFTPISHEAATAEIIAHAKSLD
ncbi:MAG: ribbon-helix-helix protein, CopG family [Hyphomicrobiaceae bacterium]|nr:ribbon-helix-helix protein, CopG family [Hyphomicrobiaceae bacterium]